MIQKVKVQSTAYDERGNILLTLNISRIYKQEISALEGELDLTLAKHREKRSLDANAYAWALMNKLAAVTRIKVSDIYREYIKDVGGNFTVICIQEKNAERFKRDWEKDKIGWQAIQEDSKIDGCVNFYCYEGSSVFDTAQMSRLINMIQQDCKEQGIETATPDELNNMLSLWEEKQC